MAINSGFSHYIKMVIFHSYVSLPEGTIYECVLGMVITCDNP